MHLPASHTTTLSLAGIGILTLLFFIALPGQNLRAEQPMIPPHDQRSQPDPDKDELQELIMNYLENLPETEESETDHISMIEILESLAAHPINLNNASAGELRQLFMLSEWQIIQLINHIERHGKLTSIYELQTIEGFSVSDIRTIMPFVTVSDALSRRQFTRSAIMDEGEHVLFLRYQQLLEQQKGFSSISPEELLANPNARYPGSPLRLYARYRFTWYRNISIGLTAEKDPGEEFFSGSQPRGFDFYSAHLFLRDLGRIRAITIGDFQAQFGQGLVFWSGMGFGKSSEGIGIKKNGLGLRPYTSVDENNFMRGTGITMQAGPFELTFFYSSKHRDASVSQTDSLTGKPLVISSLQQSGLHRTPRELAGKNAVQERISGSNITFRRNTLKVGLTGYLYRLGAEYQRNLSFYNQFEFSSNRWHTAGADYSYLSRNMHFFGEVAIGANRKMALINGAMISLHRQFSIALIHRHYDPAYQSPFAAAFGEHSRVANEKGLYFGARWQISPRLTFHTYADHFAFPWMKFRTYMPTRGSDYQMNLDFEPSRETKISLRFRRRVKPMNITPGTNNTANGNHIRLVEEVGRSQFRLNLSYHATPSVNLRNRMEYTTHTQGNIKESGFLIYQDILYRNPRHPLALTFRLALFDTDGFNSRIYAYEHDVLYAFSFPFYSDQGLRAYMVTRWRLHRKIDLYARLARTRYTNRNYSGSGLDRIEGPSRTEVKAQIRLRF